MVAERIVVGMNTWRLVGPSPVPAVLHLVSNKVLEKVLVSLKTFGSMISNFM